MTKLFSLIFILAILSGCASNREYNTSSFKYKSHTPNVQNIALNENGLTSSINSLFNKADKPIK